MATLVSALFLTPESAERGVEGLLRLGYTKDEIGVVMSDATKMKDYGPAEVLAQSSNTDRGAKVGGILGATLAGAITVGAFAVMGPFAALLAGMSGGMMGSLAGAIVGDQVSADRTKHLDDRLSDGGILVGVYVRPPLDLDETRVVLNRAGGEFVQKN